MKRTLVFIAMISTVLMSSSFKTDECNVKLPLFSCSPPTLSFYDSSGFLVSSPLCRFVYYEVRTSGTSNAVITSISGGTLTGKNGCDLPGGCNWRIRPTTTAGMSIQIYGQCDVGGQLVTSPTATYNYVVSICPK